MDEHELIKRLAGNVGVPIPKHIVQLLREDRYLSTEDEDYDFEDTLRRTRLLLKWSPKAPRGRAGRTDKEVQVIAANEELRRTAVSEYWAGDADRQPPVQRFRADVLSDQLLSRDEACAFLTSPAAGMFSPETFRQHKIDPARHQAHIASQDIPALGGDYGAVVQIRKPSVKLTFARSGKGARSDEGPLGDMSFKVRSEGRILEFNCWTLSTLDVLCRAAEALERQRYPWQAGDAAWFLLTGEIPLIPAIGHKVDWLMGTRGTRAVITIEVEPWISVDRVTDLYKRLQDQIIGRHNRPVSERRIAVLRFINDRIRSDGTLTSWRALMAEWNQTRPTWPYENVRNFSRDYWAAARALVFPMYHPFRSKERGDGKKGQR